MTNISLGVEQIRTSRPDLYAAFFRRKYHRVDGFEDWRIAPLFSARVASNPDGFIEEYSQRFYGQYRNAYDAVNGLKLWLDCDCTMFFVSRAILEAVKRTKPPPADVLDDFHTPLPLTHFVLPKGGFQIGSQTISNISIGLIETPLKIAMVASNPETRMLIQSIFPGEYFAASLPMSHVRRVLDEGWDAYVETFKDSQVIDHDEQGVVLFNTLLRVAVNLVLAMQVEPTLLQPGKRRGPCKREKNRDIFEPHIIGARYRSERRTAGATAPGSHASPAMHWRIGHWRTQNHGTRERLPDGKLGKFTGKPVRTWIKPILVNAPEGDDGSTAKIQT